MTINHVWLIAAALAATGAHAADAPKKASVKFLDHFCRPGEEILDHTESCLDNRIFVDEAEACLDRLKAEADRVSKGMAGSFSKDATAAQTNKFGSSAEDYVYASATFADLITLTNQVMDEADSYLDYMNLPEDISNDEATEGDPVAYAEKMPCYSETQESLDSIQDDLGDMLKQFTDGKQASDAAGGLSTARKANLDAKDSASTPGLAKARPGAALKPSVAPSANPKSGASDITGVKEDQQKQLQK